MAYIYDLTDTWNAGGTTFNAIKMNVTDSASAVTSKLVSLQTNGTEHFSVTKAGVGYVSGNVGIGTSSPAQKLDVNGAMRVGGASGVGYINFSSTVAFDTSAIGCGVTTGFGDSLGLAVQNATGIMTFATNSTERMRIDASGNVGVGTSSPDVFARGYSGRILGISSAGQSAIELNSATGNGAYFDFGVNGTRTASIYSDASSTDFSALGARILSLGTSGAAALVLNTNSSERARIDSSGNVGIGTASPGYKLTVAGSGGTATVSLLETGVRSWGIRVGGASTNTFDIADFTAGTSRLLIDGSGNVGIGTSSPSSKLTVAGSNVTVNAGYGIAFTGDQTRIMTPEDNVYGALINWGAAGGCRFIAGTSERMRIDGTGNLLVGKSSTGSEVTTDGAVFYKNASGGGMTTYLTNGGVGTVLAVSTQGDTQAIIFFRSGSNVGNISVTTTATAYNTSSDYRLKDIDGPVANSGAYIDALKPVQGSWKADGSRFIGLLAHEAQEVSETPIATGEKDGEEMQAMDYSAPEIIANLIAELQSMRLRLAQLEGN